MLSRILRRLSQECARAFPDSAPNVERTVEVATGESVAFHYELAGLGSRFYALFIDLAIQILVLIGALLFLAWIGSTGGPPVKLPSNEEKFVDAVAIGLLIFGVFALFFGYFILFEWRWNGRTPGKRLLGIRVVRDGGFPLDFTGSVVRNVVRVVEALLGFYAVSAVVMLLSPENRRLGDMAAGTLVVRDAPYRHAGNVQADEVRELDPAVRGLGAAERDLIRNYGARRDALEPRAREALARTIAATVRPKLGANYDHLGDDQLLTFLADHALA